MEPPGTSQLSQGRDIMTYEENDCVQCTVYSRLLFFGVFNRFGLVQIMMT